MASELKQTADGLSNDGGAKVSNVHLFGNVWGGEVHYHAKLAFHRWRADPINQNISNQLGHKLWLQVHVDKPRSSNLKL